MELSEQLEQDNVCGDFGKALEGYSERAKELEKKVEKLQFIQDAWNELSRARNIKCTCSGFLIQYEGCQCDASKKVTCCEHKLWGLIKAI